MNLCIASMILGLSANPALAWMGQALLYGTLLAGLTWLFVRLFQKRIPSSFQAALWCIVLIKFIVPMGPGWSFSLESLCESLWQSSATMPAQTSFTTADLEIFELSPADGIASSVPASAPGHFSWLAILVGTYFAFVVALMFRGLLAYRRLRKRCEALPVAADWVRDRVQLACREVSVRRIPDVRVTNGDDAPFVLGGWKPLLVLSRRHLTRIDLLDTVVVHEVAHLRRGDFVVRYIQWIAGSLLFYWPVVTWVNRQIDLARENACDEWALQKGKLSAADYARCLLDAVKHRSSQSVAFQSAAYHPACMAANPATIERRIDMILQSRNMRKGSAWFVLASAMVIAWGGFSLAGGASNEGIASEPQAVVVKEIASENTDEEDTRPLMVEAKYKTEQWFAEVRDRVSTIEAADTNADGEVSGSEITNYLAARAFANPEGVIDAYPFVDLDQDGELSVGEALYFASGKRPIAAERSGHVIRAEGEQVVVTNSESGVTITADSIEVGNNSDQANSRRVRRSAGSGRMLELHSIAGRRKWILDHGDVEPTAGELVEAAVLFEHIVSEQYLAAHPDADADGDGTLTFEERTSHQEETKLQRFLGAFPEADTNADGILTAEERAAFETDENQDHWKRKTELELIERSRAGR
ncbi:MAG: hypothetical protein KDA54_10715 [Phycisphaerales bacterium]|nr:hypothetical protein [Phycisphaerales bacterium]